MADIDDLKKSFEKVGSALGRPDASALSALFHEQFVAYGLFSAFPMEGKARLHQSHETYFSYVESATFAPINPQFRVVGSTGIVWGHTAITTKPKDGPVNTTFARFTFIFTKTDTQWLEVAAHTSLIPTGNNAGTVG